MASIGTGWVDGAWIQASWATGAWSSEATCTVTGTLTSGATEATVVAGGGTLILTLIGDTWAAAGAAFNAQRQNIIDGLDSAQSETLGWNAEVRDKEVVGAVVRTSNTVVTITLTAAPLYDITANETITVTVPASALVTSGSPVIAAPTVGVSFVAVPSAVLPGAGGGLKKHRRTGRRYPRRVMVDGKTYWVRNAREERDLIQMLLAASREEAEKAQEALAEAQEAAPVPKRVRAKIRRMERRLEKAEDEVDTWMQYLRERDEDIIMLLAN